MIREIDRSVYYYIIQIETYLLMEYKINPFDLTEYLSVSDIQQYLEIITDKEKEKREAMGKNTDNLWKGLIGIRDILNMMTMR